MTNPALLFALATAIWGTTWIVITFQLGVVDPVVSVVYRFALASVILLVWCRVYRRPLDFEPRIHGWLAAQGTTLFGLNYVAVYIAERHVASGLVAVAFSTIVFMVPIGARLMFGTPITPRIAVGAVLGVAGVALLFAPELRGATHGSSAALGIAYALGATVIAAIGNLVTVRLQRDGVPALSGNAWGMGYGALTAAAAAVVSGSVWAFDWRLPYVASLIYLTVLGSIVAFGVYFRLLRRVGAGRASFIGVSTPVVAMVLSTAFEGYQWTYAAAAGAALALAGNVLALTGARR
jgi:drug/metabolite transporter (DMT)-like permease